jgi:hypothetical protein
VSVGAFANVCLQSCCACSLLHTPSFNTTANKAAAPLAIGEVDNSRSTEVCVGSVRYCAWIGDLLVGDEWVMDKSACTGLSVAAWCLL